MTTEPHRVAAAERRGEGRSVLWIVLERPERANAYDARMLRALSGILDGAAEDPGVRAVVFTGAGDRAFCSGADLDELAQRSAADAMSLHSRELFDRIANAPWPTVAAINGVAAAGGLEMALSCDVRLASPGARFSLPEPRLALIPAAGATRRLPALIGPSRSAEMILFGRTVDAATAAAWGLVNYTGDDYLERSLRWAEEVSRADALAVTLAKRVLAAAGPPPSSVPEAAAQAALYERRRRKDGA